MQMKKCNFALTVSIVALALSGIGKESYYDFNNFRNAGVKNFQVPLFLTEGKGGFTYEGFIDSANGSDLRVFDSDGALLPYEIENWTPGGTSVVWVKVPDFSSSTKLKLSWGDADAAAPQQTSLKSFWDDPVAVFHFGRVAGLNSANGDVFGSASGTVDYDNAPLGRGALFNRTAYYLKAKASKDEYFPENLGEFSISFWVKSDKLSKGYDQTYLFQIGSGTYQVALLFNWDVSASVKFFWHGSAIGNWGVGGSTLTLPSDGGWHHIAYTYDGEKFTAYRDGHVEYEKAFSGFAIKAWSADSSFAIGSISTGGHKFDGMLDELRFERVCRDSAWVRAAVETQAIGGFGNRELTIPFSDYDGAELEDFPAYIYLDENMGLPMSTFVNGLSNGEITISDLRSGKLLPVDVEYAYNNEMEKSAGIWVRMPRYSSQDGVVVNYRIPFYSPGISSKNEVDFSKVWTNESDVLVFHMNPTGRLYDVAHGQTLGLRVKDEINYERAGAYPVPCAGPTGPYQAYHSTTNARQDSTLKFTLSSPLTNVWTVSWWAKEDEEEFAAPKKETYVWTIKDMSLLKGSGYSGHGTSGNKMALYSGGKGCNLEIPDAAWHHYAYAADGVNVYCYRDGELMKTSQWSKNFAFNEQFSGAVRLMSSSNAGKDAFRGCADEFRLESVCRSADWIRASYLNQLAWRNGTPWQFAPHLTGFSGEVDSSGKLRAEAVLSCRTAAAITFYWGESDGGERPEMWRNSKELGDFNDLESAVVSVAFPKAGVRYACRFRAENEYGAVWTEPCHVTGPYTLSRGVKAKITVNYNGDEVLEDFPLCVRIPAWRQLPDDCSALSFYDEEGRSLAWEAENYVGSNSGTNTFWIRVPRLSSATELTMHFAGAHPSCGLWNKDCVWDPKKYAGVWHFAPSQKFITEDSTSFGANIILNEIGAVTTNGVAGPTFHFPRTTSGNFYSEDRGTPFNDFGNGFSFSIWLRIPDSSDGPQIFTKHELADKSGFSGYMQYHIRYNVQSSAPNLVDFSIYNANKTLYPSLSIVKIGLIGSLSAEDSVADAIRALCRVQRPDEDWHHYAFVNDGMFLKTYLDGECVKSVFWPFVLNAGLLNNKRMQTFFGNDINQYSRALGTIDEYRVERTGRSAAWIKACYENLRPGSTFVTVNEPYGNGTVILVR